jgi:glycosyltransferase involved in cell wall biosynthesis
MNPGVSIVMPCFNAETFVEKSINSVLGQTFSNFELITVNDGSTDNTLAVLRQHANGDHRIRVLSQSNKGVSAARNLGLEMASGKYVAFLDADDYWDEEFLSLMVSAIEGSGAALAYCGWQNIGSKSSSNEPFIPPDYEDEDKLEKLFRNCRWPIHAALSERAAVVSAGGFDERFKTSEDYYLWLQVAGFNPIVRVPKVLAYYIHHGESQATSNAANMALNHFSVQQEFLRSYPQVQEIIGEHIPDLTYGELLRKGYNCYWRHDLQSARKIFKKVMMARYGSLSDWKYMAPSLLPLGLHEALMRMFRQENGPCS